MSQPAANTDLIPPELRFEHQKVLHIVNIMKSLNLTLKKFLNAFLNNNDTEVKSRRALQNYALPPMGQAVTDPEKESLGTPFLYKLIKSKVLRDGDNSGGLEKEDTEDLQALIDLEDDTLPYAASGVKETRSEKRARSIAILLL
ncbi:hypothetical protein PtB15_18B306 [Puccinia triticina]|nr:hypothetical protein PtB15_18B306 [Puccinia triticina]